MIFDESRHIFTVLLSDAANTSLSLNRNIRASFIRRMIFFTKGCLLLPW
ncbi:hypothetical protein [Xylanibacter ruminicola]|nr:hypothetical protein [Xylanibacter ruminicola]